MRLTVAVLALLVWSGCPGPEDRPCPIIGTGASSSTSVTLDPVSGTFLSPGPVTLQVFPQALGLCADGTQTFPEEVAVTVYGPGGQEVPAQAQLLQGLAEVSLTAEAPGWYHLEARFLPSHGLSQLDFLVTRPVGSTSTTLAAQCQGLDRTTQGTWVCDQRVFRGGEHVQSLTEPFSRWVGGAQVWTVALGEVKRFTDTGTGPLEQTAIGTTAAQTVLTATTIGEDALLLRDNQRLFRLEAQSDGGVVETHSAELGFGEVVHVEGELVLVDQFGERGHALQTYRLDDADAGFQPVGTPRMVSSLMGVSQEGVWNSNGAAVRVFAPSADGVAVRGSAIVPVDVFLQRQIRGPPVLMPSLGTSSVGLFRSGSEGLEIVHLREVPFLYGATREFGWVIEGDRTRVLTW